MAEVRPWPAANQSPAAVVRRAVDLEGQDRAVPAFLAQPSALDPECQPGEQLRQIVEARHGDPLFHGGIARAQDDLEDVLQAVLWTLLECRRDELRQRQETGLAGLQISRHQDGAIEPGDLKQLLSKCVERTEIRMIAGQREARAPLA